MSGVYDWLESESAAEQSRSLIDTFGALLKVKRISLVWASIDRHFSGFDAEGVDEMFSQHFSMLTGLALADMHSAKGESDPNFYRQLIVIRLVSACSDALDEFKRAEMMSGAERRALADRLSAIAQEYGRLLSRLSGVGGHGFLPLIEQRTEYFVSQIAGRAYRHTDESDLELMKKGVRVGATLGARSVIHNLPALLATISNGADLWAEQRPVVVRTGSNKAARTFFIRKMSEFFYTELGSPLRQAVLILTSAFFDIDDLDVSAVAKLAPAPST